MILSFKTHWPKEMGEHAGKPTYFVEKILAGMDFEKDVLPFFDITYDVNFHKDNSVINFFKKYNYDFDLDAFDNYSDPRVPSPKLHTIRQDKRNRWKVGNKIDFFINSRTKNMLRFAPTLEVTSVQEIEITKNDHWASIYLDQGDRETYLYEWHKEDLPMLNKLAINDGFENIIHFGQYFSKNFQGKIIHWTDLKY